MITHLSRFSTLVFLVTIAGLLASCTPFALPARPTVPRPMPTGTPASPSSPEIRQAYETLRTADAFANAHVGVIGMTPDTVLALRAILEDPAAAQLFRQLLTEAALPGQLYALAGLYLIDPDEARAAAAPYLANDAEVETVFGCLVGPEKVSDLAAQILEGDLPRSLVELVTPTVEQIEQDLVLQVELETPRTITPGGRIDLDVFLVNESAQHEYPVVKMGDGSEVGWREPHVYFTASRKGNDGAWKDVPPAKYGRCGVYDPDWQKDIVQLGPGDNINLEWLPPPSLMLDLREPGLVRLYVHYQYGAGTSTRGQTPVNLGGMAGIPAFEVVSAPVEIEIVSS